MIVEVHDFHILVSYFHFTWDIWNEVHVLFQTCLLRNTLLCFHNWSISKWIDHVLLLLVKEINPIKTVGDPQATLPWLPHNLLDAIVGQHQRGESWKSTQTQTKKNIKDSTEITHG